MPGFGETSARPAARRSGAGGDQVKLGEVGAVAADVARQQRRAFHDGMGTNDEVRENARTDAAGLAVAPVRGSGQEKGGKGRSRNCDFARSTECIYLLS